MKIAGFRKNSFVDYRGKISAVVFTLGCNLNCFFCHNRSLICGNGCGTIDEDAVLSLLKDRRRFLDAVVISGGEPTLQKDLAVFISKVKMMGYPVKLDTNGTCPSILSELIENRLIDYVAMDLKAPLDRYDEICGVHVDISKVEKSIDILLEGKIDYEFRTTVIPELHQEDIIHIANRITGAGLYILQQYRRPIVSESLVDYRLLKTPYSNSFIKDLTNEIKGLVKNYETRGAML